MTGQVTLLWACLACLVALVAAVPVSDDDEDRKPPAKRFWSPSTAPPPAPTPRRPRRWPTGTPWTAQSRCSVADQVDALYQAQSVALQDFKDVRFAFVHGFRSSANDDRAWACLLLGSADDSEPESDEEPVEPHERWRQDDADVEDAVRFAEDADAAEAAEEAEEDRQVDLVEPYLDAIDARTFDDVRGLEEQEDDEHDVEAMVTERGAEFDDQAMLEATETPIQRHERLLMQEEYQEMRDYEASVS